MRKPRKQKRVTIPVHRDLAHNAGFFLAIGGLVVNWANNESVFMAMLQALVGGERHTATIIWHSHRTTAARLELIARLAREQVQDETLVRDIENAISRFKGFSRTRNFFCHGPTISTQKCGCAAHTASRSHRTATRYVLKISR
jgi:hypothetical protein